MNIDSGNNITTKTYLPDYFQNKSLLAIFQEMVANTLASRELVRQLFLRDLKTKYKQSLLGWLWLFVMPFIAMSTFLFLNMSGVITIGHIPVPYPIFGLLGISLWQIFSNGWSVLNGSLLSGSALIGKISFPKEALLISMLGQIIVEFLVRLSLVLLVYLAYGLSPSIWILLLPLYLLPLLLLISGLGLITSLLNVIIRDTGNFINLITTLLIFLMPVMYTIPEEGLLGIINHYNPLYFLIETPKQIIISGTFNQPLAFLLSSLLALIIFLFGWYVFYISQPKIVERL